MTLQPSLLPPPPGRYARVAVAAPVAETFTYRIPAPVDEVTLPGCRVRVRFGGRVVPGIVTATGVGLPDGLEDDDVRDVEDCLDREPPLSPSLLALTERVAAEHLVGWGEVLALALPAIGRAETARRVRLAPGAGRAETESAADRLLRSIVDAGGRDRWLRVRDVARRARVPAPLGQLHVLHASGRILLEDEWQGRAKGAARNVVRAVAPASEEARTAVSRAPAQRRTLERLWAGADPWVQEADLVRDLEVGASVFAALESKGLVERRREVVETESGWRLGAGGAGTFELTGDQRRALGRILEATSENRAAPLLLHGVTGSGKTEVYLRAAARVIESGRDVLLLVPEIGLTPQLEERARAVLGDAIAVLHSGQSAGERSREWWRARTGEARVVVGPRSAVFAPLGDVGLIVVDEEQDNAYKQEERPRYNGRDVALWRAELEGAVIVLGSATPSVESYRSARVGDWSLMEMPRRVARRPMPEVAVVDMRQEWRDANRNLVSRQLQERIGDRLGRGEQALVLLNRRGFASTLICRACGERFECPDCSVTLTFHRRERALRCHYCDHRRARPGVCDQCGSDALHELGFGTERLEAVLRDTFPAARIGRFDADQTRARGAHARILSAFGGGEIDVLVGTQMLAKGHDFPTVTLVGVVGADAALGMPDFRASERTFQLLAQMAGRAGRGEVAGEVVMQAHQPSHYAIESATAHDFATFYEREIAFRERLRYPPFVALAACICQGKQLPVVREEADLLAATLKATGGGAVTVVGPASPPISRLRGRYRMQLLLKAASREELTLVLAEAVRELERRGKAPRSLTIDIEPRNLM